MYVAAAIQLFMYQGPDPVRKRNHYYSTRIQTRFDFIKKRWGS